MQAAVGERVSVRRGGVQDRADLFYAAVNRRILWQSMSGPLPADPYRRLCGAFSLMAANAGLPPGVLAERSGAAVETLRRMETWTEATPPDAADVRKLLVFFCIDDQPLDRWLPSLMA